MRAGSEHENQKALFDWARLQARKDPRWLLLFAIPNAAKRSIGAGRYMKSEGLSAGVPDMFLATPHPQHHGLFIELKTGRNKETPLQELWRKRLSAAGYCSIVCHSWQQAANAIAHYLAQAPAKYLLTPALEVVKDD